MQGDKPHYLTFTGHKYANSPTFSPSTFFLQLVNHPHCPTPLPPTHLSLITPIPQLNIYPPASAWGCNSASSPSLSLHLSSLAVKLAVQKQEGTQEKGLTGSNSSITGFFQPPSLLHLLSGCTYVRPSFGKARLETQPAAAHKAPKIDKNNKVRRR